MKHECTTVLLALSLSLMVIDDGSSQRVTDVSKMIQENPKVSRLATGRILLSYQFDWWDDKVYSAVVTQEQFEDSPEWLDISQEPPLPLHVAIQKAKSEYRYYNKSDGEIVKCELNKIKEKLWYYSIVFKINPKDVPHKIAPYSAEPCMPIFVLMSGVCIKWKPEEMP